MARRDKAREEQHRTNMARHSRICGPKSVFAGVALTACQGACGEALKIADCVVDPKHAPALPLVGCGREACLCSWNTVTWIKAEADPRYTLIVRPRR